MPYQPLPDTEDKPDLSHKTSSLCWFKTPICPHKDSWTNAHTQAHFHSTFFLIALTGSEGGSYLLPWRPKLWEAQCVAKKSHFIRSVIKSFILCCYQWHYDFIFIVVWHKRSEKPREQGEASVCCNLTCTRKRCATFIWTFCLTVHM